MPIPAIGFIRGHFISSTLGGCDEASWAPFVSLIEGKKWLPDFAVRAVRRQFSLVDLYLPLLDRDFFISDSILPEFGLVSLR